MMRAMFIDEPELEFGGGGRHIDIRHGLREHGPLDKGNELAPKTVRLGVIGTAKDLEKFREWMGRCRTGIDGKESRLTTLFVGFPGFGDGQHFCDFVCEDRLTDTLSTGDVERIGAFDRDTFATQSAVRFEEGGAHLIENANADVVACLLPETFVRRIDVPTTPDSGPRSRRRGRTEEEDVWHDCFKARALRLSRPVQVVRPGTYGGGVWRYRRDGKAVRAMQDEATRAWNFFVAVYYKAGGIPWRLAREVTDFSTCYAGISFYVDPASATMRTSVAQIFNERGEGMIVRGGPAELDDEDKTPHLSAADAESLLAKVLTAYRREHRNAPARLVCHKSSYYNANELAGCKAAAGLAQIDAVDLVSLRRSHTRLFRAGMYPSDLRVMRAQMAFFGSPCPSVSYVLTLRRTGGYGVRYVQHVRHVRRHFGHIKTQLVTDQGEGLARFGA